MKVSRLSSWGGGTGSARYYWQEHVTLERIAQVKSEEGEQEERPGAIIGWLEDNWKRLAKAIGALIGGLASLYATLRGIILIGGLLIDLQQLAIDQEQLPLERRAPQLEY